MSILGGRGRVRLPSALLHQPTHTSLQFQVRSLQANVPSLLITRPPPPVSTSQQAYEGSYFKGEQEDELLAYRRRRIKEGAISPLPLPELEGETGECVGVSTVAEGVSTVSRGGGRGGGAAAGGRRRPARRDTGVCECVRVRVKQKQTG